MNIKLENISKAYTQHKIELNILNDFSYTFESGKLYVLKGESGKGKTTLLSIIGLLRKPNKGMIWFDDKNIMELSERKKAEIRSREIGFIFQEYNLFPELSVLDNVILAEVCTKKMTMEAATQRAKEHLEFLGLTAKAGVPAKLLSGGEQQRANIARALMKQSSVLICDEPVSNLDEKNTAHIVSAIDELCHKEHKIVIVSSHDSVFDDLADEMVEL